MNEANSANFALLASFLRFEIEIILATSSPHDSISIEILQTVMFDIKGLFILSVSMCLRESASVCVAG